MGVVRQMFSIDRHTCMDKIPGHQTFSLPTGYSLLTAADGLPFYPQKQNNGTDKNSNRALADTGFYGGRVFSGHPFCDDAAQIPSAPTRPQLLFWYGAWLVVCAVCDGGGTGQN